MWMIKENEWEEGSMGEWTRGNENWRRTNLWMRVVKWSLLKEKKRNIIYDIQKAITAAMKEKIEENWI